MELESMSDKEDFKLNLRINIKDIQNYELLSSKKRMPK